MNDEAVVTIMTNWLLTCNYSNACLYYRHLIYTYIAQIESSDVGKCKKINTSLIVYMM